MHCIITNPSEEGKDSPMSTLIEGLIVMIGVHIQEKQKTGDNLMFLKLRINFKGKGGGGGVRLSKGLPPHSSDLALP